MSKIGPSHWSTFLSLLAEIERDASIPIGTDNVLNTLWKQTGGRFLPEQTAHAVALKDPEMIRRSNDVHMVLCACSVGFPQFRTGFDTATLAVKILDTRLGAGGNANYPFAYDLFSNGRRVLIFSGLRLDHEPRFSRNRPGTILADLTSLSAVFPEYHRLVTRLIETFPDKDDRRTRAAKESALSELAAS